MATETVEEQTELASMANETETAKETTTGTAVDEMQLELQHYPQQQKQYQLRYSLIVAILVIIVLFILMIYFASLDRDCNQSVSSSQDASKSTNETSSLLEPLCDSQACLNLAFDISHSINTSVDPCHDFAEYVCAGWQADNDWQLSKYQRYLSLMELGNKAKQIFLNALTNENPLWEESSVAAAKVFYDSCYFSEEKDEDLQSENLLQGFIQMVNFSDYNLDGVSLDPSDSEISNIEWDIEKAIGFQEAMVWSLKHEWNNLFRIFVEDEGIIAIEQNAANWISYNRSNWEYKMIDTFLTSYMSLFGLTIDEAFFVAELVLDFNDQVATIATADDNYLDLILKAQYTQNTTIDALNSLFGGQVDLLDYEQLVIDIFECTDISCVDTVVYLEPDIEFFNNLTILINETSPYIVQYWFFTNILDNYNYGIKSESFEQSRFEDRRNYCFDQILQTFPHVYGYILSINTYPHENNELASSITEKVLNDGVTALIQEVNWLDDYSLTNSLKKAENMDLYVGLPPNMSNIDEINKYYYDISMNLNLSNGFISNYGLILEFNANNEVKLFHGEGISLHDSWPSLFGVRDYYPSWLTGLNAFYYPFKMGNEKGNFFFMSESIIQSPLFDLEYPMLVNYAAGGFVVGQQILHGFDSSGSQYDFEGNKAEIWTNETVQLYDGRTQCFIDQYDQIEVETDIFVNGTRTNIENIADNGGMAATRAAYKQWKLDNNIDIDPQQIILPGLEFTEEQLWWISYGRVWCNIHTPGYYDPSDYFGVDAPPSARINGVVSNFQEFADAFQCSTGTPMNSENKCGLWQN